MRAPHTRPVSTPDVHVVGIDSGRSHTCWPSNAILVQSMTDRGSENTRTDSAAIVFASVVNGLAAYAVVVVVSRAYDEVDFAAFSVAWSIWALAVALLVFPIQNWIIWRSTIDSGTAAVRRSLPRVIALVSLVLGVLFLAGSSSRLCPEGEIWPQVLLAIGASSAVLGFARGLLAGTGRYRAVAFIIGAENVIRLGVVALVVRSTPSPEAAALALSAGLIVLIPFVGQLRMDRAVSPRPVRVVAELGSLAGATALAQTLVQFPPAYAEWLGESPATVSALFATFAIGRAPILILLALTTRLTEPLTRLLSRTSRDQVVVLRRALLWFGGVLIVTYLSGLTVGPDVVAWFFGEGRALSGSDTALVALGLGMAMGGVLAILVLLGLNASGLATVYWLAGVVCAVALGATGVGLPAAFVVGEALPTIAAVFTIRNLWRRRVDPGVR